MPPTLHLRVHLNRRRVAIAGVAVLVLLIGAVGLVLVGGDGGGSTNPTNRGGGTSPRAAFAACMHDHGIEHLPGPTAAGPNAAGGSSPPSSAPSEEMTAALDACQPILEAAAPSWEKVVPGGDCQCSDGSEFSFWVHEGNPHKVVLYLQGGGACWSAETCDPDGSNEYEATASVRPGTSPGTTTGIFDFADKRNPFADYSFVFVPYCTGDVHLGNATTRYSSGLTVHHKGYVNGTAALDHLATTFPDATDVVVVGASAGSVAAPLYAGLATDRLPGARITSISDGSGGYPDAPGFAAIARAWGLGHAIPDWPENAGMTPDRWTFPQLFVQSGRHDPDIVFARHDYAFDHEQTAKLALLGQPTDDLVSLIDANETHIEAGGVHLLSYIAPGDGHLALDTAHLYTETVNGHPLATWITALVTHHPVHDVHCTTCRTGGR
jgi:hypothetical protein